MVESNETEKNSLKSEKLTKRIGFLKERAVRMKGREVRDILKLIDEEVLEHVIKERPTSRIRCRKEVERNNYDENAAMSLEEGPTETYKEDEAPEPEVVKVMGVEDEAPETKFDKLRDTEELSKKEDTEPKAEDVVTISDAVHIMEYETFYFTNVLI